MNLIFNAFDHNSYSELKNLLNINKIKYKVVNDDMCTVSFKVSKDDVNDFQINLANNIFGARIPGSFYVEN